MVEGLEETGVGRCCGSLFLHYMEPTFAVQKKRKICAPFRLGDSSDVAKRLSEWGLGNPCLFPKKGADEHFCEIHVPAAQLLIETAATFDISEASTILLATSRQDHQWPSLGDVMFFC